MRRFVLSPVLVFCVCFAIYMGWGSVVLSAVAAAVCHEAGHIAALALMRVRIRRIRVGFDGAVLETAPMGYLQEIFCAVCGPLINFVLFFACVRSWFVFSFCNLIFLCYNILPVFPLDGGRILRAVLLLCFSDGTAVRVLHLARIITFVGISVVGVLLMVQFRCGVWPIITAGFLWWKFRRSAVAEGD